MNKYSVDYSELEQSMSRPKAYRYSDVKDRLVKVAFDVVRFVDSEGIDGLWQVQATDDGEVIVAMYEDDSNSLESVASSNDWHTILDKSASFVNVFYKDAFITKLAAEDVGVDDVVLLSESLPESLSSNHTLRTAMINELPKEEKEELLSKYPELK